MSLPTLSVIVPNYNHGHYLPACLDAMLGQGVPPNELIVIDDGSTDNSLEVLKPYAERHKSVRVLRNDRNRGVSYTLNVGMDVATGDYLFFPAADDQVKPGVFEKSLRLLAKHPEAALSCSVSEWHDSVSGLKWYMGAGLGSSACYLSPADLVQLGRRGKLIIPTSSAIYRKEPLYKAQRFISDLRWHSDWFAAAVTSLRHGLCFVPEVLSEVHLFPTSYYNKGRKTSDHHEVLTRLLQLLKSSEFEDVAPRVRDSAAMGLFGVPLVRLAMSKPEYRTFITPLLLYRCFRRSGELVAKKVLPKFIARLALKVAYNHKPQSVAS